jgi:CRISPR-associated protein Cas2
MESSEDIRDYTRFRKFLIKNGFVMMQESVYSKIVFNNTAGEAVKGKVRQNKTKGGLIQMLTVTEKQFSEIELVIGESHSDVVSNDEKLVVL